VQPREIDLRPFVGRTPLLLEPINVDSASHPSASNAAIGRCFRRREDPELVQGQGRYTDDLCLPGQLYGVVIRSPYAHGVLKAIDAQDARNMSGVLGIYTGADLVHYAPLTSPLSIKGRDGKGLHGNGRPAFPIDKVRFVGDPLALVVAETERQARDAAEAVVLDIDPLPAVVQGEDAVAEGAPRLYEHVARNIALDFYEGDSDAVEAAFAKAAHITHLEIVDNRVIVNAMEPRAAIADYDAESERYIIRLGSQGVFGMRAGLAQVMKVPPDKVRVLTGHVGGSFGMKSSVFPEYIALLHATRELRRPIKWTDTRSESFVSDHQGRDNVIHASLALDPDGRFLALRLSVVANLGAYLTPWPAVISTSNIMRNAISVYRTPLIESSVICAFTNTVPIGAYRGAGRPEGNYIMERLVDTAAREIGRDPVELRKINHIQPDELPYVTPLGTAYDSGDFSGVLEHALESADWDGFGTRRAESERRGLLRGRGVGQYLEITAPAMNEMGGIRFDESGDVTIVTGTLDYGQGHATPFAQVLSAQLGIPFECIRLVQGDSDQLVAGGGTGGSKSIMASGTAIVEASLKIIERGRVAAAHVLEAASADIEFSRGAFRIAGTDRSIGLIELARILRDRKDLPPACPTTLDVTHVHKISPSTYPNGCHIAEVEVDPQTGVVQVVRYTMANDFGTIINPMIVAGQAHGGVLQGIGQALMERTHVDASGQLQTGSFQDYCLPRAEDAPPFVIENHPTIAETNPLGVKGCGEAGCAGSLPSVMNALIDALSPCGVTHINMPATPETVWRLASFRSL
jgi:carbon-monoxide dehydrogenase large subunit